MTIYLNNQKVHNLNKICLRFKTYLLNNWIKVLVQATLILYQWIQISIKIWIKTIEKFIKQTHQ